MFIESEIVINSSKDTVWNDLINIENSLNVFEDIKAIEIIHKNEDSLVGLKWKETRELMGKQASEIMYIIEANELSDYTAEAINSGCLYHTTVSVQDSDNQVVVKKSFRAKPITFIAKIFYPLMLLMKGTLNKCLIKDLRDLKTYSESKNL